MPKKIRQLIQNKTNLLFTFLFVVVGVFFITNYVSASVFSTIWEGFSDPLKFASDLLTAIFLLVVRFLGVLFVFFVGIMIELAKFNNFIDMPMVATGWGLARDIANMFFIVVLLIIAFSTVLKISSYHYQKTLTKLLIMAILVNFSKLIAGFLIDFFQVIMLTFVNGFKDVAGGNLAQGLGIYEMLSQGVWASDVSGFQEGLVVAAALAVVMILVADMVILVMIAVLMWRITMLWVLVIISPLAYLAYAFKPNYWSQWWQMFFQHLISGPVIAFFLWLALLTMQQGDIANKFSSQGTGELKSQMSQIIPSNVDQSVILNYIVVLALLLGGLAISQKIAAQSGGAVGNFAQKVQKWGTRAAMLGTGAAAVGWAVKKTKEAPGKAAGQLGGYLSRSEGVRNVLGAIGGSKIIGLNTLATKALAMAENKRAADRKKVNDIYGSINDPRILQRFVNSKIPSVRRDVMRRKAPSLIKDKTLAREYLAKMDADDFARLSDEEIYNLGNSGIDLRGTKHEDALLRNRYRRGLYNSGAHYSGFNDIKIAGIDENGKILAGDLNKPGDPVFGRAILPADLDRMSRTGNHLNHYRDVAKEELDLKKGPGNLEVDDFASEKANVLAVDFDNKNFEKLDLLKGKTGDPSKVKSISIQNKNDLKDVAKALVQLLDGQIKELKTKGGKENEIKNLEKAKERLKDSKNLKNLNLVNSSSRGYSESDFKEATIREKIHGYGLTDEAEVEQLVKSVLENKQEDKIEELVKEKISSDKTKTVNQILSDEATNQSLVSVLNDIKRSIDTQNKTIPLIHDLLISYGKEAKIPPNSSESPEEHF